GWSTRGRTSRPPAAAGATGPWPGRSGSAGDPSGRCDAPPATTRSRRAARGPGGVRPRVRGSPVARVVPEGALAGEGIGLGWTPGAAVVGVHRPRRVEHGLEDTPRLLDDVLTGESPWVAGDGVAQQALVGVLALSQRSREVDRQIDGLAVDLLARRL